MTADRRRSPRFACDLETEMRARGHVTTAQTIDLSFSGICVLAAEPVAVGEPVEFQLRLVFEVGGTDAIDLKGEAVWCTAVAQGFQVGCRFSRGMPGSTWRRLDLALQFMRGDLELG